MEEIEIYSGLVDSHHTSIQDSLKEEADRLNTLLQILYIFNLEFVEKELWIKILFAIHSKFFSSSASLVILKNLTENKYVKVFSTGKIDGTDPLEIEPDHELINLFTKRDAQNQLYFPMRTYLREEIIGVLKDSDSIRILNQLDVEVIIPLWGRVNFYGFLTVGAPVNQQYYTHLQFKDMSDFSKVAILALENIRLLDMALMDPLTSSFSRRYMEFQLRNLILHSYNNKTPLTIAMIDIDHFKKINDSYGHLMGDLVLKTISKMFYHLLQKDYLFFRYGGEEFTILFQGATVEQVKPIIEEAMFLLKNIQFLNEETDFYITMSVGLTEYRGEAPKDMLTMIQEADDALYRAKNNGRNQYQVYSDSRN